MRQQFVFFLAASLVPVMILAAEPHFNPQPHALSDKLENVFQVTPRFYSGGQPEGDEAFAALAKFGVKTLVSVDGATPDVAAAKRHGLRYIHIPFGYGGIPREAELALTRAAKECEGPIYVHCHHGKHRGPAGMAIMCQAIGVATAEESHDYLVEAGTAAKYAGLYDNVANYKPPQANEMAPELVEVAEVPELAMQMVEIDRLFETLAKETTNRRAAVELAELFRELARLDKVNDVDYMQLANSAANAAEEVGARDNAQQSYVRVLQATCNKCHEVYRD
jgi:protein tyrosine phosphatase (PTP) superfamily phosphohydrolase (DUF442 family)